MFRDKRYCASCNKDVEILDVIPHEDHDEQVLSCGHTFKFVDANASDTISITDMVERQVTKVRTLTEGPILVSGESGTSLTSGSVEVTMINGDVTGGIVNFNFYTYTQKNIQSNTTINNLQDIFALVDKTSDFSQGEKDKAKGTLETIYDEVTTAGVRLGPFIQLLGSLLPK